MDLENPDTEVDIEENELLIDTITNFQICKQLYSTLYNSVGDNLQKMLVNTPMQYQEATSRDMQLNSWIFLNFKEHLSCIEVMTSYNYFYFYV